MNWLMKFMYGRHGSDQLSLALFILSLILYGIGNFQMGAAQVVLCLLSVALLAYSLFRMLSRNHDKRWAENQKFLSLMQPVTQWLSRARSRWSDRKAYHYFHCPKCGASLRVPRGRGKICITCPVCKKEFVRKA